MSDVPTVTVLIPARNEEADIERCLRAVLAQDHPHDRMEIVLVDGGSSDRTAQIAAAALQGHDVSWRILHNERGSTPSSLNAGLAVASGEIVCRVDARSFVPPHYVRTCASILMHRSDVVVTGGSQRAIAPTGTTVGRGIARALNNRFTMGGARYRSGASSGPDDTVYLGAFREKQLRAVGGWDERFLTNQDFELNRRLGRGGVVWFDDSIAVDYRPRATLTALWEQYLRFGRAKARYWRLTGDRPLRRQRMLLATPMAGASLAAWYVASGRKSALRCAWVALVSVGGLAALDHVGSRQPASVGERAVASVAGVVVSAGWLVGVIGERSSSLVCAISAPVARGASPVEQAAPNCGPSEVGSGAL